MARRSMLQESRVRLVRAHFCIVIPTLGIEFSPEIQTSSLETLPQ